MCKQILTGAALLSIVACGIGEDTEADLRKHKLGIEIQIHEDSEGRIPALTQVATVTHLTRDEVKGAPVYIAAFDGGFSPGNDRPRYHEWGEISDDLTFSFRTDAQFVDGPYDIAVVVYARTEISQELLDSVEAMQEQAPYPQGGDLAGLMLDEDPILEGDPAPPAGVLRMNVHGSDTILTIGNAVPEDEEDLDQLTEAFKLTLMYMP